MKTIEYDQIDKLTLIQLIRMKDEYIEELKEIISRLEDGHDFLTKELSRRS